MSDTKKDLAKAKEVYEDLRACGVEAFSSLMAMDLLTQEPKNVPERLADYLEIDKEAATLISIEAAAIGYVSMEMAEQGAAFNKEVLGR